MERKYFAILVVLFLILDCSCAISSAIETGTEAEGITITTEESASSSSSSSTSAHPRGRSLSFGENEAGDDQGSGGGGDAKRNPKFGFTLPIPNILNVLGMNFNVNTTPKPGQEGGGAANGDMTSSASIGTTAVLIKGGILSGLLALKAAILPPIFFGALILFLIAGAGFFTCSVVNCGRFIGDIAIGGPGSGSSGGFGTLPNFNNPFNRNGAGHGLGGVGLGIEEFDQRPVFQALDDSYKKFN